jgi:hypothetical protein
MTSMLPNISEGFTAASFTGRYGAVRTCHGAHRQSASVGVLTFTGDGRWSGAAIANVPGEAFGQRRQVEGTVQGTYDLEENGSGFGSMRAVWTFADEQTSERAATFLVTRASRTDDVPLIEEFWVMEDAVDPASGGIHMVHACRHPDAGSFTLASMSGTYGGPGIGHGGGVPAAAVGLGAVRFDGNGGFVGVDLQNLAGPSGFATRQTMTFDTEAAQYVLNPDGTGMIIAPGGRANLVVMHAAVEGELKVVLDYVFVNTELHPPTGNLVLTSVSKRLI